LAVFLLGQTLRYGYEARQFDKQTASVEASLASNEASARTRDFLQTMIDFAAATDGAVALEAMTDAFSALGAFDVEATQWRFDGERFSMSIDAPPDRRVRDIVNALERSRRLCAVIPEIAAERVELSGRVELEGVCPQGEDGV
jgi:hypothetical protein